EDVKIMKELGFDAFRFSISWSRLLPSGKLSGGINIDGINFYHNLVDELLSKGGKIGIILDSRWFVPYSDSIADQNAARRALDFMYGWCVYPINQTIRPERNGVPIGPATALSWLHVYPRGIRDLLVYTMKEYNNPLLYITENGVDDWNNKTLPLEEALKDPMRIDYYQQHLWFLRKAIE
ncbi:Glycoside hydrolase family 1, partial [Dillenia turbinata]